MDDTLNIIDKTVKPKIYKGSNNTHYIYSYNQKILFNSR